ncbi:hypothetical protein ACFQ0T_00510 [Kitasatospora gansuensis]
MTSYRPGSARLTLATAVLATVLTLTACEPNVVGAEADAAPSTAPASPTAARPADPSTPSAAASSARPGRRTLAEAAVAADWPRPPATARSPTFRWTRARCARACTW